MIFQIKRQEKLTESHFHVSPLFCCCFHSLVVLMHSRRPVANPRGPTFHWTLSFLFPRTNHPLFSGVGLDHDLKLRGQSYSRSLQPHHRNRRGGKEGGFVRIVRRQNQQCSPTKHPTEKRKTKRKKSWGGCGFFVCPKTTVSF